MLKRRESGGEPERIGVVEVAAVLGRWPHPDELAAVRELAGSDLPLSAAGVVAGSLRFGCAAVARDRPEGHGRDFTAARLAGLLELLGVDRSLVVALHVSVGSGVRLGLAWPAPPPPGLVAVSDLVWALHPAVSAGRLCQVVETAPPPTVRWVPVGEELAVNLVAAPQVGVTAPGPELETLVDQLRPRVEVEVDPDASTLTLEPDEGCRSVWSMTGSGPGPVSVVATVEGWRVDPWDFVSVESRQVGGDDDAPGSVDVAGDEATSQDSEDPAGEQAGTSVVSIAAAPPPVTGDLDEGWWGAPVLDLVAAGQSQRSRVEASGVVQAGIDAVLAGCAVEVRVLGQDPSVEGVTGGLQPKPLAVLCFLAVGGSVAGEEVWEQFWTGSSNRSAMDNALTKLRRCLEPGGAGLVFDRDARSYHLDNVGVDLHRFARLVELSGQCLSVIDRLAVGAAALDLVEGPVLAGVGGEAWAWWHDEPDHYAHTEKLILDTADHVATGALALGDPLLAQRAARAGLLVVPGHERLGQLAMAAAHAGGDRDGVRAAYRLLERCLKAVDPDDCLSEETEDLYRSLLGRDSA